MPAWTIWANYDFEAKVWYTLQSEVPGLLAKGETIEELERKIGERFTDSWKAMPISSPTSPG